MEKHGAPPNGGLAGRTSRLLHAAASAMSGSMELSYRGRANIADDPFALHERTFRVTTREEEEEELELAAFEALHRRQLDERSSLVLRRRDGRLQLVDMKRWTLTQRRSLLHLVMSEQEQAEDMLRRLRARYDAAGVPLPGVLLRFRNLSAAGRVAVPAPPPKGASARLRAGVKGALTVLAGTAETREFTVLQGCSGVLRPGTFTLLLGPPGAGKTTLLRALAGRLQSGSGLQVSYDELTYNGRTLAEFQPACTAAYVPQLGMHFGELTCRETLDFSARCRLRRPLQGSAEAAAELEARERQLGIAPDRRVASFMDALAQPSRHLLVTDLVLRLLGLEGVGDTLVGNAMIRGVSGGQRKRVTVGEMLVGPMNPLLADEISNGLDSAATHDLCAALRALAHTMNGTVVVALLQPSPETLALADDVMLLSAGRLVLHGPRDLVLPFFAAQGLPCPPGQSPAAFLQQVVTHTDQQKHWAGEASAYCFIGAEQLADAWAATPAGIAAARELQAPAERDVPGGSGELATHKYARPLRTLAAAVVRRGFAMQRRNMRYVVIRLLQSAVMGFCCGTLFIQQNKNTVQEGNLFMSIAYFSTLVQQAGAFSAPTIMTNRLPAYYAQRDAHFYPAWCIAVAELLVQLPICFMESWIWTLLVYFIVGFDYSPRVFVFWAMMLLSNCFTLTLFFVVASLARNHTVAAAIQSFLNVVLLGSAGFLIAAPYMPKAWLGAYWANPFAFFIRAVCVNEMTSPAWNTPVPGEGTVGSVVLQLRGYTSSYIWVWSALAFGLGSCCLNAGVLAAALTWLSMPGKPHVKTERALLEGRAAREGAGALASHEAAQLERWRDAAKAEAAAALEKLSATSKPDVEEGCGATARATNGKTEDAPRDRDAGKGSGPGTKAARQLGRRPTMRFPRVTLTFRQVEYSVELQAAGGARSKPAGSGGGQPGERSGGSAADADRHAGRLVLLRGISGAFQPGVLCALMGPSGAGKSTLLDVLALRKTVGLTTGDIRLNGKPLEGATLKRVSGYVEQTDVHLPQSTVEEAVRFSAALRLPAGTTSAEVAAHAEEVMCLVELAAIRGSPVGVPGQWGLSQEQRKRLTIAVELVANPSLLFLDEPTTGLDGRAAELVMRAVRAAAATGRTVVATVHQPSPTIFASFGELLLLQRGGQQAFFGPLGPGAAALCSYLTALPGVAPLAAGQSPADWMIEALAAPKAGTDFAAAWAASDAASALDAQIAALEAAAEGLDGGGLGPGGRAPAAPGFWAQLGHLLVRNLRQFVRLRQYQATRLYVTLLIGLLYGWLFWDQAARLSPPVAAVSDVLFIANAFYMGAVFFGRQNSLMVQEAIHVRRSVFFRERAAGLYGCLPYAAAEFLADVPFSLFNSTLYSMFFYLMLGLPGNGGHFGWMFLVTALSSLYWVYLGMAMVHVAPNLQLARTYAAFILPLFNLFCGLLKPRPQFPAGWVWAWYVSPMSWSQYALVVTQMGTLDSTYVLVPDQNQTGQPLPTVPEYLESYFGYHYSMRGWLVLILVGYIAAFFGIAYLALRRLSFVRR